MLFKEKDPLRETTRLILKQHKRVTKQPVPKEIADLTHEVLTCASDIFDDGKRQGTSGVELMSLTQFMKEYKLDHDNCPQHTFESFMDYVRMMYGCYEWGYETGRTQA